MECEPKTLWIHCQRRIAYLRGRKIETEETLETQWNAIYKNQPVEVQEIVARQILKFMENA